MATKQGKPIEIVREDITILKQKNLSLEYKLNKLENLLKDLQAKSKKEEEDIVIVNKPSWWYYPQ
tara:strand:+ start:907 stop:1101 length:195 start_codon:yes stop_codon:yes gene_type:complete